MLADVMRNPKFGHIFSFILGVGLIVVVLHQDCKEGNAAGCKRMKAPSPGEVQDAVYNIGGDCYKFKTKQVACPAKDVIESFKQDFRIRATA
jgi:hypothetical protein